MKSESAINPLKQVRLDVLMNVTSGNPQITIGLIDGPVNFAHPAFQRSNIRTVRDSQFSECKSANSLAGLHGTIKTGMLCASCVLSALAICPGCKLLLYPIFQEKKRKHQMLRIIPIHLIFLLVLLKSYQTQLSNGGCKSQSYQY
jgi:hypothetical protein